MGDRGHDPLLDSLKVLYELKKNNPNDGETENKFFNAILAYLLGSQADHWWCSKELEPFVRESVMLFSLPAYDHITQYKARMNRQLATCRKCLDAYHKSKPVLRQSYEQLYSAENVAQFFQQLEQFDADRILATFQQTRAVLTDNQSSETSALDVNAISCAIHDIIANPGVLNIRNLDNQFASTIVAMQSSSSWRFPEFDISAGLFTLTLHQNKTIRLFARKQIEQFAGSGHELNGAMSEDLKQRAKRILTYLGSLNPTYSKAEIEPENEPFPLTDQAGEYWKSFRYLSSCVTGSTLLIWIRSSPVNMESLILSHLQDGSMWFHEVLKLFTILLTKLKAQFWSKPPTQFSEYKVYMDHIFSNRVFRNLMQLLSQGDSKSVVHQNDGTPIPLEKVTVRLNGILEWIIPFWLSFCDSAIHTAVTDAIMEYMFTVFQQPNVPSVMRARSLENGLSVVSESMTRGGRPPSVIINKNASLIVATCLKPNCKLICSKTRDGYQLLRQIAIADAKAVRDAYFHLYSIRPISQREAPYGCICDKLWKELCNVEFDISSATHMQALGDIFKAHAFIALLDIDIIHGNAQQSEARQQQIQFVLDSLMIMKTNILSLLQSLLDRHANQISTIIRQDSITPYALHLLASPDRDIRSTGVSIFREAFNEEAFFDCLMQYFRVSPNHALDATIRLMTDYNDLIDGGCNMFSAAAPVFATLTSVINALIGNEDSLLFHVITSGELALAGDQDRLQKLWSTVWVCIGKSTRAALGWAQNYRPKEVVKAVLPVLQIASHIIGTFRTFEQIVQMKDTQKSGSIGWSSQSVALLSYNELAKAIDPLSEWIFVTSNDVLRLLVPLLIMSLKRLTQTQVKVSSDTYDRLMGAATGAAESRITSDEKENLFMALSPHDPTNTVFFDETDDEDDTNWKPASNSGLGTNFLDPSLLAPVNTTSLQPIPATPPSPSPKKLRQPTLAEVFAAATGKPASTSDITVKTEHVQSQKKLTDYLAKQTQKVIEISDDEDKDKPKPAPQKKAKAEDAADDEFDDGFDDIDLSQIPEEWFDAEKARVQGEKANGKHEERLKARQLELLNAAQANMQAKKLSNRNRVHLQLNTPAYAVGPSKGGLPGRKLRPPTMGLSKLQALRRDFNTTRTHSATPVSSQTKREQSSQQDSDDSGDESAFAELISDFDKSKLAYAPKDKERFSGAILDDGPRRSVKLIDAPITAGANFQEKKKQMQRALERKKKVKPSMRGLHKTILSWDITVEGDMPPEATRDMYKHVPSQFSDINEYVQVFEPLLLLEVWMQLLRAKEEATESDVIDNCMIESRCNVDEFVDVTIQMTLASARALAIDDLVYVANHFGSTFFSKSDGQPHKWIGKGFLSKVKSMVNKRDLADVTVRCYFPPSQMTMLNSLAPKSIWRALKLCSLTTAHREYAALKALEYYDLCDMVLKPKPQPIVSVPERELVRCMNTFKVNQPQAEAITGALQREKGFTLIQGPPGTGKTKTILGLVASLISQQAAKNTRSSIQTPGNEQTTDLSGKLLICAPSNAAVDEIVKRLMQGIAGPDGKIFPKIVRIGKSESINSSVKDVCLETLIGKEVESLNLRKMKNDKKGNVREKLLEEMRKIKLTLDELDKEMAQAEGDPVKYATINDRRRALMGKKRNLAVSLDEESNKRTEFSRDLEIAKQRAKTKILSEADVVSCTLSGSGHEMLTTIGISFETVIIDEAAQSIEISSLIPLKYDCQRCVLVGDPNQLPPTVLSLVASKYSYEQSLFVRLQKNAPDDVFLLSIQYRMHPEISLFPSKLFYESRLKDGPDMAKLTTAEWHDEQTFFPYQFLNILDGKESMGSGKSLYNTHEADAAVTLVDMLASRYPSVNFAYRIGVITPYKQQLRELKNKFERRFGREILNIIDFNTVDGFQGQEKDIIIFSCVRAGSDRGIGFLSDIRRMNVGLTRAKSSLFVLGHSQSLNGSQYWGDLVADAKRRSLHIDCRSPLFGHRMHSGYHPPNLFKKAVSATAAIPEVVTSSSLTPSRLTGKKVRRASVTHMDIDEPSRAATSPPRLKRSLVSETPLADTINQDTGTTPETAEPNNKSRLNMENSGIDTNGANTVSPMSLRQDNIPSGSRKLTLAEYQAKRAKLNPHSQSKDTAKIGSSTFSIPSVLPTKPGAGLFIPKAKRPADRNHPSKEMAMSARERLTLQAEANRAALKRMAANDRAASKKAKRELGSNSNSDILDDLLDSITRT